MKHNELDLKARYENCMANNLCFISLKPLTQEKSVRLTKEFGLPLDVDFIDIDISYMIEYEMRGNLIN